MNRDKKAWKVATIGKKRQKWAERMVERVLNVSKITLKCEKAGKGAKNNQQFAKWVKRDLKKGRRW